MRQLVHLHTNWTRVADREFDRNRVTPGWVTGNSAIYLSPLCHVGCDLDVCPFDLEHVWQIVCHVVNLGTECERGRSIDCWPFSTFSHNFYPSHVKNWGRIGELPESSFQDQPSTQALIYCWCGDAVLVGRIDTFSLPIFLWVIL